MCDIWNGPGKVSMLGNRKLPPVFGAWTGKRRKFYAMLLRSSGFAFSVHAKTIQKPGFAGNLTHL